MKWVSDPDETNERHMLRAQKAEEDKVQEVQRSYQNIFIISDHP